jgi:SAM-dependent methyltransferase
MIDAYIHGYSSAEANRLARQADILADFIHGSLSFAPGARILEAGCGVGSQTMQLLARHPFTRFVAVDRSPASVELAAKRVEGHSNAEFHVGDILALPFEASQFDGAFVCFVLEHLTNPALALTELQRVLKPGARMHVFEGDHGSVLARPHSPAITHLVNAVSRLQMDRGGDPCMGRALAPLLLAAGFTDVRVEPCVAYADTTRRDWIDGFTRATFNSMVAGQRDAVLSAGLLDEAQWNEGMRALERTTAPDGSFCYTFFRASAVRR